MDGCQRFWRLPILVTHLSLSGIRQHTLYSGFSRRQQRQVVETLPVTYGSMAHLRQTHSAKPSSLVHQSLAQRSPPSSRPRKRRHLRKKNRPFHLSGNILSRDDRPVALEPAFCPATPENRPKASLPPAGTSAVLTPTIPSSSAALPALPSNKRLLLTHFGSSTNPWGVADVQQKVHRLFHWSHANGNAWSTSSFSCSGAHASPPSVLRHSKEIEWITGRHLAFTHASSPFHQPRR